MLRRRALQGLAVLVYGGAVARLGHATSATDVVAATTSGRIRGSVNGGIYAFKGVPYGADTAKRRFLPPVAPTPWRGVRDALRFGSIAPQTEPARGQRMSEDCLNLNLWTPGLRGGKRPVMVWFHPGGYSGDSSNNPDVDGARLSRRGDVVVVTVNHRLNVFGYLYLAELVGGELADSGNAGMLDLVLALHWVRDNIAEFGGDPSQVTIFGQSGGGAKCATLMAMPAAAGLFQRVITMSGQQITASRPASGTAHAQELLRALQLPDARARDLQTLPMQRLAELSRAPSYLGPVKDGRSLPRDPFDPDAPPLSAHIPMILGNTRGETRTLIGRRDPSLFSLTWETLLPALQANSPFMGSLDRARVIERYRALYPSYGPSDVFFAATTDSRSWRGQVIEADRRAAQPPGAASTWVYQLDWATPVDGGKWGAHHGLDVALAFDNAPLVPEVVGREPSAASQVAAQISQAFIAFAHSGNPNHAGIPNWQPYDLPRRATLVFDTVSRLVPDPRRPTRELFAPVPYVQPGT
jgi:para-nitrobenzyl esterase